MFGFFSGSDSLRHYPKVDSQRHNLLLLISYIFCFECSVLATGLLNPFSNVSTLQGSNQWTILRHIKNLKFSINGNALPKSVHVQNFDTHNQINLSRHFCIFYCLWSQHDLPTDKYVTHSSNYQQSFALNPSLGNWCLLLKQDPSTLQVPTWALLFILELRN